MQVRDATRGGPVVGEDGWDVHDQTTIKPPTGWRIQTLLRMKKHQPEWPSTSLVTGEGRLQR